MMQLAMPIERRKTMLAKNSRERLKNWINDQLIGPSPYMGTSEDDGLFIKNNNPIDRFPCGAIYPLFEGEGVDPSDYVSNEIEELNDKKPDDDGIEPETIRRYVPPSSIGLSFYLAGLSTSIEVSYYASCYKYDNAKRYWLRSQMEDIHMTFYSPTEGYYRDRREIWSGSAFADVLWRKHNEGWIITVSLCNKQQITGSHKSSTEFSKYRAEKTLFEARFKLYIIEGEVDNYLSIDNSLLDEEEQEIELQYRNRKVYAIGHGTGVDWKANEAGTIKSINTEPIPTTEIPQITTTYAGCGQTLKLSYLAGTSDNKGDVVDKLTEFVQGYSSWIEEQEEKVKQFQQNDKLVGTRITNRMREAEKRMRLGIELLKNDEESLLAFSLANQAILNQMIQHNGAENPKKTYAWRPFQLAFLLTVIESATDENSVHRDLVDLIWFPTGGGKTEAYLGLIAYTIVLRRLKYPDTYGGTAALMRYTLRLLAKDQFLRAARMICALELIRSQRDDLGVTPISIGMWVGGGASPNNYDEALKILDKAKNAGSEPSLVIDECPWCGELFSISSESYHSSRDSFYFVCKNKLCEFKGKPLPCNVVDDHLYDNPPSLIVSTIDKFARMPWEKRVGNFFGKPNNRPPELIIQDELHLISGALGSINGLYEAAIDSIIKLRGFYPKYIASTATIRTADTQIKRLYGREAAVFPPPGITCDNSYYAKTVPLKEKPGRLYFGYYAPMLNRQKCLVPLAAALLAAPASLFAYDKDKDLLLDYWWTFVVYHGSLKGLANSHMAFDYDVRDWLRIIVDEINNSPEENLDVEKKRAVVELIEKRMTPLVEELTSHKSAAENADTFSKLEINYPAEGYLDVALATNMVSVGLDVGRLALMVINGQPLTTAEYIQASSRVGRSNVPGIVFINYYRDQTRSLSHYEQFRAYHEAFYRYVEPTSVTPFTWQARIKALHAALVSVIRHGIDGITEASCFSDQLPEVKCAINVLKKRCSEADNQLLKNVHEHIDSLSERWAYEAKHLNEARRGFKYDSNGNRAYESLLCNFDDTIQGLWQTLQSMRNVESTALLKETSQYIPIRFSHLLGYSGPGAIIRGPRSVMVVQDTSTWKDKDGKEGATQILYVERVKNALGILQELYAPPAAQEVRNGYIEGICVPATFFPRWMRCPKCGRLYSRDIWKSQDTDTPICTDPADSNKRKCKGVRLEQVQHVVVHPEGYLADVGWHFLTHKNDKNECKIKDKLILDVNEADNRRQLRCEACKAATRFDVNDPQSLGHVNKQPWLYDKPVQEPFRSDGNARIRKVNDSLVYSPVAESALVIPPESSVRKGTPVDLLYRSAEDRKRIDNMDNELAKAKTDLQCRRARRVIDNLAKEYKCSVREIEDAIKEIEDGYPFYGQVFSNSRLYEDEYKAFLDKTEHKADEDFVTHNYSSGWREFVNSSKHSPLVLSRANTIQELVKVDRLKEVRVFKGFKREFGDTIVPPDVLGEADWLPAIELYGEGIFFTVDEKSLTEWEQNKLVNKRLQSINKRFNASGMESPQKLTARFILLHTLSHLLIRQLEASGGYPAASLKERLYCNPGNSEYPMSGILIYTTAPDKSGTLGGLAELTEPRYFLNILSQALDHARWCSSDPVCSEHDGQGPGLLNLAACHACALIPDTACMYGNLLLDRAMIGGDMILGLPTPFDILREA